MCVGLKFGQFDTGLRHGICLFVTAPLYMYQEHYRKQSAFPVSGMKLGNCIRLSLELFAQAFSCLREKTDLLLAVL